MVPQNIKYEVYQFPSITYEKGYMPGRTQTYLLKRFCMAFYGFNNWEGFFRVELSVQSNPIAKISIKLNFLRGLVSL